MPRTAAKPAAPEPPQPMFPDELNHLGFLLYLDPAAGRATAHGWQTRLAADLHTTHQAIKRWLGTAPRRPGDAPAPVPPVMAALIRDAAAVADLLKMWEYQPGHGLSRRMAELLRATAPR